MGKDIKAAALLAVRDGNARRGPSTPVVEVDFYDDSCSAEGGKLVATQIATLGRETRPIAIVGHACPSASQAAGLIYSAAGIVFIATEALPARAMPMRRDGPHQFRLPGEGSQGALIASTLLDTPDARVAILRDRTQYAIEATQTILSGLGGKSRMIVVHQHFAGGEKEFSGLVQRIKEAAVSHVVISAFPSEAGLLVTEIRKVDPDIVVLATDQLADPEFARIAATAADGVLVPLPADYSRGPAAKEVMRRIDASDAFSSRAALLTYAALECLLSALDGNWPTTATKVSQALSTGQFATILGTLRFDSDGNASLPKYELFSWSGGQLVRKFPKSTTGHGVATRAPLP